MVDLRIYRAAFVFALLAAVVCMFSLESRPPALSSTLAPDAFDDRGATDTMREIVARHPDRRAGTSGDAATANVVRSRLDGLGFETSRDEFGADVDGERASLVNVTGVLSGPSEKQLVVLAHRDAARRGGVASAAATATLLELARALAAARHELTLVFVSLDAGEAGGAGARRFADRYESRGDVEAALVLDDIAAARANRPYVVPWSTNGLRSSLQLLRTIEAALGRELGAGARAAHPLGQFVQQAWPLTLRDQGPLVSAGMDAATLTARGELPRPPAEDVAADFSRLRLARSGKAALASVLALDAARRLERSPSGYLTLGRQVLPRWSVALLALGFLIPVFVAALDAFARTRRRAQPAGRWLQWALALSVPFLIVVVAAKLFELVGWLPGSATEALAPATRPRFAEVAPPLGALAVLFALGLLVARRVVGARELRPPASGAAVTLALLLSVEVLVLWLGNPFAALLLLPVVHLCLLMALPDGTNRRALVLAAVASALLLPAVVLVYYGAQLDLGVDVTRYLLLVLAGQDSLWAGMLGSLIAGSLVATIVIALTRPGRAREAEITIRGPSTYAGPGSLGGTRSALRR